MPIKFEDVTVNENSSCLLEFVVKDPSGTAISSANINSATMSLRDKNTSAVINSRLNVDVSGDIDTNGLFSRSLSSSDNIILNDNNDCEIHIVTISINATVGGSTIDIVENIWISILNLRLV